MKKYLFIILFIYFPCFSSLHKAQEISSSQEIDKIMKNFSTSFTWKHKYIQCTFVYENQESGFALKFSQIPFYWYNYRVLPNFLELKQLATKSPMYHVETPLVVKKNSPQHISFEKLKNILHNEYCYLYTGAGISCAAGIPTMKILEKSLELHKGKYHFLKNIWNNPKEVTYAFTFFCKACLDQQPTAAHYAVKDIAVKNNCTVITENIDILHQKTGIKPISGSSQEFKKIASQEKLKKVNFIICIGLSYDDRGLLAYYKKNNPNGVLIAIDFKKPNYLSEEDYFFKGNIQQILPQLAKGLFTPPQK